MPDAAADPECFDHWHAPGMALPKPGGRIINEE